MSVQFAAVLCFAIIAAGYLLKRFGRGLTAVIVVAVLVLVGVFGLVHSFATFSDRTLVATVRATPVANQAHMMVVEMTTYDGWGNPTDTSYELGGDRFMLQAQVVEFQPWLLFMGVKSGYHLQRLEGQYDGDTANSKPVQLGSWSWFNGLENNVGLFFPVAESAYENAVIEVADGRMYNVYVDSAGDLSAERA